MEKFFPLKIVQITPKKIERIIFMEEKLIEKLIEKLPQSHEQNFEPNPCGGHTQKHSGNIESHPGCESQASRLWERAKKFS